MRASPGSDGDAALPEPDGGADDLSASAVAQKTGYRAATGAAGILRREDLAVFAMWGRDPVRMLNGLITNDLARLTPEASVYGAMLTPKGRMITDLRVVDARAEGGDGGLLLVVPAVAAAAVADHLRKYVPPLFARWEARQESLAVVTVLGPLAARVVERLLGTNPPVQVGGVTAGARGDATVRAVTEPIGSVPAWDLLVPREELPTLLAEAEDEAERLGGGRVDAAVLHTLRVEGGVPTFGREMSEESLPAEAFESTGRMPAAVSFTKGCYTGQEVVVRIAHRGHVNRHVRGIVLGEFHPEAGAALHHPDTGREVGRITSVTRSPKLGTIVGLGIVRREVVPGDVVRVGAPDGPEARVADLPFATT